MCYNSSIYGTQTIYVKGRGAYNSSIYGTQAISGVKGPWATIPAYTVLRQSQVLMAHGLQFQHIWYSDISGNGPWAIIPAYMVLRQSQV